jgi:hypothetical protein
MVSGISVPQDQQKLSRAGGDPSETRQEGWTHPQTSVKLQGTTPVTSPVMYQGHLMG